MPLDLASLKSVQMFAAALLASNRSIDGVVHGARFRQKFTPEDAIGSHVCSLEASRTVTNGVLLGCLLFLPVRTL
jgi:hypothetical protein